MKKKYIDKYGNIWTKSVKDGLVFCTKYGYGLYDNGNGLTPLNNNYMLTPISTKIEEFEYKMAELMHLADKRDYKGYAKAGAELTILFENALQQRDEEWRELVEQQHERLPKDDIWSEWENGYFQALGDIITKSKENNL